MKASKVIHKLVDAFVILAEAHAASDILKRCSGLQEALAWPGGVSSSMLADGMLWQHYTADAAGI